MTDLEKEVADWVKQQVEEDGLDEAARRRIEDVLGNWLAFTARKKSSAGLPKQIEAFRKRIRLLADNLSLGTGPHGVVVKATGDAELTLRQLGRGTDWFDPAQNVPEMIVEAVFESSI